MNLYKINNNLTKTILLIIIIILNASCTNFKDEIIVQDEEIIFEDIVNFEYAKPTSYHEIRDYWTNQEPIPWVRIYKGADHVHFPHMRHVAANVDCTTCHGEVKEMDVIETVNQPLSMGWCVSCHVEQDVRRDCTVCHY